MKKTKKGKVKRKSKSKVQGEPEPKKEKVLDSEILVVKEEVMEESENVQISIGNEQEVKVLEIKETDPMPSVDAMVDQEIEENTTRNENKQDCTQDSEVLKTVQGPNDSLAVPKPTTESEEKNDSSKDDTARGDSSKVDSTENDSSKTDEDETKLVIDTPAENLPKSEITVEKTDEWIIYSNRKRTIFVPVENVKNDRTETVTKVSNIFS